MLRALLCHCLRARPDRSSFRPFLILSVVALGACASPTEPYRDPCDQGLFFTEPETSIPAGVTITQFVWRGARGISFMGDGQECGRSDIQASWSSSDVRVAAVRPSQRPYALPTEVEIHAVAPGQAEIRARAGGREATLRVTVVAP